MAFTSFTMGIPGIGKFLAAWLAMLVVSIVNGVVREFTYGKHMSELAAHQLSTVTSVLSLGVVIWVFGRINPPSSARHAFAIGLGWAALTVAFEFLFFHFVGGHPWAELLSNYNILEGRVWVLVVLWITVAPLVFLPFHRRGQFAPERQEPS